MKEGGPKAEQRKRERFLAKVYAEIAAAIKDDKEVTLDISEHSVDLVNWSKARPTKAKTGVITWTITFTPRGM